MADPIADVERKFLEEIRNLMLYVADTENLLWKISDRYAAPPEGFDPLKAGFDEWHHDIADDVAGVDDAVWALRQAIQKHARHLRPLVIARVRAEAERAALEAQLALPSGVKGRRDTRRRRRVRGGKVPASGTGEVRS